MVACCQDIDIKNCINCMWFKCCKNPSTELVVATRLETWNYLAIMAMPTLFAGMLFEVIGAKEANVYRTSEVIAYEVQA